MNKDDIWFIKQNLQNDLDVILVNFEKKGIKIKSIDLVRYPTGTISSRVDIELKRE